ncbi:MAG: hypothetical protein NC120_08610 [Ruminococcus sp.]|nr:hypothetical protein [Ruminococcus sp.]
MCQKRITGIILAAVATAGLTACSQQTQTADISLTQEERELAAIREWFAADITDEEEFPDKKDYQYYARAVGLDKDAFLSAEMWEVFYSENININRDVDEKAVYLIRLDPNKLLEIYAENNDTTVERVCGKLSLTPEQLYYNFGYTATAVNYSKNHKDGKAAYSADEAEIFGIDNGENRQTVMSTHFLTVDLEDDYSVTYSNTIPEMEIRQRDILRSTTKMTYNYSEYTEDEKNPAVIINGIGIRRVLPLSVPNGWINAEDKDITVMFNASPFSYGCTDSDKVTLFENKPESEAGE